MRPPLHGDTTARARSARPFPASAGSFLSTGVVYPAGRLGDRLSTYASLLAGVVFNALASAAITFIEALSAPERLGDLVYWLAGALDYPEWPSVAGVLVFEALGLAAIFHRAAELNLLSLGDEGAASLGVEVDRARRALFFATSLCVAAAVAVSGLVGFVGLIVPHLLRLWLGPDQRLLLPASAVGGALFSGAGRSLGAAALPAPRDFGTGGGAHGAHRGAGLSMDAAAIGP